MNLLELEESGIVAGMEGQKIMIYGSNDTGKTYQAARLDRPIILGTEQGSNAVKAHKIFPKNWAQCTDFFAQLTNASTLTAMRAKYQTVVIDTAENLIELLEQSVCNEFGASDLGEIGEMKIPGTNKNQPNGYTTARKRFKIQIDKLTKVGYTVVFIAHENTIERPNVMTGLKEPFVLPKDTDKAKSSMRYIRDICDFVIYVQSRGLNQETKEPELSMGICKETSYVFARSRYKVKPFIVPFTAENLVDTIIKGAEATAEDQNSGFVDRSTLINEGYTLEQLQSMIKPYVVGCFQGTDVNKAACLEIIETVLGIGRKISDAQDNEVSSLEIIYNKLVAYTMANGVIVETMTASEVIGEQPVVNTAPTSVVTPAHPTVSQPTVEEKVEAVTPKLEHKEPPKVETPKVEEVKIETPVEQPVAEKPKTTRKKKEPTPAPVEQVEQVEETPASPVVEVVADTPSVSELVNELKGMFNSFQTIGRIDDYLALVTKHLGVDGRVSTATEENIPQLVALIADCKIILQ